MAQNFVPKRQDIASKAIEAATNIENALVALQQSSLDLAQTGGNFQDTDFDGTSYEYTNAYNMNVLLQTVTPALAAFLQTGTPLYDNVLRFVKTGS
jgi:hypothetical protein